MQEEQIDQNLRYFYPTRLNNNRKVTDKPCLVIYSLLSIVLLASFFYSFILEKQSNLFKPQDPNGRRCGYGEAAQYPYIYFVSPLQDSLKRAVCVKSCPETQNSVLQCLPNNLVSSCESATTGDQQTQVNIYPTQTNQFLSLCNPQASIFLFFVSSKVEHEWLINTIQHLQESYLVILGVCPLITFFLIFLYIIILHRSKDIKFLYTPIVICFDLVLLALAGYCFTTDAYEKYKNSHIVGYIVATLTILHIIYLIARSKYLFRGMELMGLASNYIRENKSLILVSGFLFILWVGTLFLIVVLLIYIYAIDIKNISPEQYQFAYGIHKQNNKIVEILLYFAVFHYVWTNIIIYHCGKYVCRAASSNWIMHVPNHFKNGIFTLFRFHLGSVVMGSALITLFAWVSSLLYFIMPDSKNRTCCGKWPKFSNFYKTQLFTKYLGFFNQLNYLIVSLDGLDFCGAGRKMTPFYVNSMQHVERAYFQARRVSQMSKILVVLVTVICCEIVIASMKLKPNLIINLIIFLFSYLLASFAFDSYDKNYETILLTILINNEHQMNMLDKVGMAPFADVGSAQTRDQVYRTIEEWYFEQGGLEALQLMSPTKSPKKAPQPLNLSLKS